MSHDYAGSINLNNRKKPVASYSEGQLKGGVKREELSEKSRLIFDAINNQDASQGSVDDILDANEMQKFWDRLREFAKDDTLGGREAGKLLKDLGLKELKKEDLYAFITELYGESEDIESSLVDESDGTIIINYKKDEEGNVVQERVHTDHTSEIETTDAQETVTTQFINADDKLTKTTVVDKENNSTTTLYTDENGDVVLNAEGDEVPTTVIQADAEEEIYRETINYETNNDGSQVYDEQGRPVPAKLTIVDNRAKCPPPTTSTTNYEDGVPANAVVVRGAKTSNYTYQEGQPVLTDTVEDLGNGLQRTTNFEYNEQGHIEHITEPDRTIERTVVNFSTADNRVVPLTTQEVIRQGTTTTTNLYNYEQGLKQETIVEEGGKQTINVYGMVPTEGEGNSLNFVKLQQAKIVNGKTYQVQYDGQGNTCGIVVQNGESPAAIAQRFGCTVEQLFEANPELVKGKGRNRYFNVGDEIKIPKELEADARVLQGRDSREVAIRKYEIYQENERMLKENGMINHGGRGQKVTLTIDGKEETFTIRGEINGSHYIAINSSGQVVYINRKKDGALSVEGAQNIIHYWNNIPEGVSEQDARNIQYGNTVYRAVAWRSNSVNGQRDDRQILLAEETGDLAIQSGSRDRNPNGTSNRFIITNATYLKASDAYMADKSCAKPGYGSQKNVRLVEIEGQTFAFDIEGNALDTDTVLSKTSEEIAQTLEAAADNKDAWYNEATDFTLGWAGVDATMGTDTDLQDQALAALRTYGRMVPGSSQGGGSAGSNVYAMTNASLGAEYQNNKDGYDAIQTLSLQENSHGFVQTEMTPIIAAVLPSASEEQINQFAQFSSNEIQHEISGYTGTADLKRAMGTVQSPEQRRAMEGMGYDAVAVIRDDGWNNIETRGFQAVWVKNNAYEAAVLKLDTNGKPILDEHGNPVYISAGDQAIRNEVIGDLISSDDDEYIRTGLDAIDTTNLVVDGQIVNWTADYLFFEHKAGELNVQRGYVRQYEDQTAGQQFIAGISTKDGTVNTDDVRTYNNNLFNDIWTTEAKTAPLIYEIRQGNYEHVFEGSDPAVYEELTLQLVCGEIEGVTDLRQVYEKALEKADGFYEETKITLSAAASGQMILKDEEILVACVSAMRMLDGEYKTADHMAEAALMYEQLNKIIENRPDLAKKLIKLISKTNITRTKYVALNPDIIIDRRSYWSSFVQTASENAIYTSQETVFKDENGQIITDPAQIQTMLETNGNVVEDLERYLAELEREFNISADDEGELTSIGRSIASSNIDMRLSGTYEEDMRVLYTQLKNMLPALKLASKGQLRDSRGNVISCKDLLTPFKQQLDFAAQKNTDFVTTGQYAKMGVILAPVIITTIVASGGVAAAGYGTIATALTAGGVTFVTEYGLNSLEAMTSQNGLTAEKNEQNLWQAATDAALAAGGVAYSEVLTGMKMEAFLTKIQVTNPYIQKVGKLGTVVLADTVASAAGEYVLTGEVTIEGMTYNAIFSAAGNIISLRAPHDMPNGGAPHNQPSQTVLGVATVDGTVHSGGKFNPEKFGTAVSEVQAQVAGGLTPEGHVQLLHEANLHQSAGPGASVQGKTIKHVIEDSTGVFTSKHGDIDINAETDIARLQEFRREVAGWNDPNRDIDGILAMIDGRIEHLNAHPELIGTPVHSEVLDLYNQNLVNQTDALLAPTGSNGKNFKLGDSDTSLIIERINKTNSLDELDTIVAGIEHRRLGGTRQDLIDNMMKAVESRRLQLRPEIDMDGFNTLMSSKATTGKGLSEAEVFDVVRLIENSTDDEFAQIETVINANKKIKKQSQIKTALETRRAKVGETPVHTATHTDESVVESTHADDPAHVDEPVHVDETPIEPTHVDEPTPHVDETPAEITPAHVDDVPSVPKTKEQISQSVAQDIESLDVEIPTAHQSNWANIKQELNELQTAFANGAKNLGQRCQATLQKLQHLASNVSGTTKVKLQKLIADFKLQLMDYGIMKPKNCTLVHTANGANGTLKTIEITYDAKGLKTKQVLKGKNGAVEGEYTYTYDANDKIKTKILKDSKGNTTENYYENGELVKTIEKDANGNVLSDSSAESEIVATIADDDIVVEVVESEPVVHDTDIDDVIVAEVVEPEPVIIANPHLADKTFTLVETLNPNNVKAALISDGISPQQKLINGNGAIKYKKDGVTYQMHYEDGKLTALRVEDAQGNKSYYTYDSAGKRTQISRDEFIVLKGASDAKYNSSLNSVNNSVLPEAEIVEAEPVIVAQVVNDMPELDLSGGAIGTKLPKDTPISFTGNETLRLYDYDLDLGSSKIQSRLRAMNDGDIITIGRAADGVDHIHIDGSSFVSNKHIQIKKVGNDYIITDISTNGTTIGKPRTASDRIHSGNGKVKIENRTGIDLNDPKYYNNVDAVLRDMQIRMEAEMGVLNASDIQSMVSRLSSELGISEQEVLNTITRITQFGNMKSLNGLTSELDRLGISSFYRKSGISTNSALSYFQKKGQITLNGIGKEAFILDDVGLKYLESLDATGRSAFMQDVNNGKVVLIQMDGTGIKLGNEYFSYTMLDGGVNLEELTRAVLVESKNGTPLNRILNGDFKQRLDNIFGSGFSSRVQDVSLRTSTPTSETVARQVRPNMPDAEDLQRIIDAVVSKKMPAGSTPEELNAARAVIAKYYDFMGSGFSTDSYGALLRDKHQQIQQRVASLGKSMDDVVYIYPTKGKSFDLVYLQYAKANGIDPSKIIHMNGNPHNSGGYVPVDPTLIEGKVVVVLDDVVGTAQTMMGQELGLSAFQSIPNTNVIISPITCAEEGRARITSALRGGKDFLIFDSSLNKNIKDFESRLSYSIIPGSTTGYSEASLFNMLIGYKGFGNNGLSTGFQYMTPDNCSELGGCLAATFLNNIEGSKASSLISGLPDLQSYLSGKYGTVF